MKKTTKKKKIQSKVKRPNGTGSIYQKSPTKWVGYVNVGKDENGKSIKKYVYGNTYTEVLKKTSEINGKILSGCY